MKKMKLELEELAVESFETAAAADESGTVHGHASGRTCPFRESCNAAIDTCYDGCPGSSLLTEPEYLCPAPSYPDVCP